MKNVALPSQLMSLFLGSLLMTGCATRAQAPTTSASTPVRVVPVTESAAGLVVRTVGVLEPATVVQLSFKLGGPVDRVLVDVGDRVQKGQLLALLLTTEADAALSQSLSALLKAERDAERMRTLYADSVVTHVQLQDAETGLEVAHARHDAASFNRSYAEIRAPFSGRIMKRSIEPGELFAPIRTALTLGGDGEWLVMASVTDIDVMSLTVGDRADLSFDALPYQLIEGRIKRIAESPDPGSGTYQIEIGLGRNVGRLRSGFIARVRIVPASSGVQTVIPAEALVRAEGRTGTVFVLDAATSTAKERSITIAGLEESHVVVSDGVKPGELIVTDGAGYLHDGSAVSVQQ